MRADGRRGGIPGGSGKQHGCAVVRHPRWQWRRVPPSAQSAFIQVFRFEINFIYHIIIPASLVERVHVCFVTFLFFRFLVF